MFISIKSIEKSLQKWVWLIVCSTVMLWGVPGVIAVVMATTVVMVTAVVMATERRRCS